MAGVDDYPRVHADSRVELRAWLAQHHTRDKGAWLVQWKKHTGERHLPWPELVAELLCWGWVDSRKRSLDADRTLLLISPRRKGSHWSAINKAHIEANDAAGLMQAPGWARIEAAKADGSWTFLDDIEALIRPPDLQAALAADPVALGHFDAFSSSSVKGLLWWVKSAKRPATRSHRISEIVRLARLGLRANTPEAKGH